MSQPPFGQGPGQPPQGPPGYGPQQGGYPPQPPGGYPQQGWGQQPPQPPQRGGNPNTPLIVILVILLVAGVGGAVFFLTQDDDDDGGGGSGTGDAATDEGQEYVDALIDSYEPGDLDNFPGTTEDDIPCLAQTIVNAVGVENIPYTPAEIRDGAGEDWEPDFSLEQAGTFYDGLADCGVQWRTALLEDLTTRGLTDSQIDCIDENISEQQLRDLMVAQIAEDQAAIDAAEQAAQAATQQCRNS